MNDFFLASCSLMHPFGRSDFDGDMFVFGFDVGVGLSGINTERTKNEDNKSEEAQRRREMGNQRI